MPTWARALLVLALLYLFLVGVSVLEAGIDQLGSDVQERLFDSVQNPMAGLFVGILATVLVQSSSVTTATIVGLVGAGLIGVDQAVPMVMGANIGTTVTNTLASLGYLRQPDAFRRAFAAATVHDFFNVLAVAILLPLELATGLLSGLAERLSRALVGSAGTEFSSPIKVVVKEPVAWVEDGFELLGLSGTALGVVMVVFGLALVFVALAFITRNMRSLIANRMERALNEVLGRGGGTVAMVLGMAMTVAVQSSSITTALLIPLCGAGILSLNNAYPVTLGANVGTTITALLASLATARPEALTVALTHTIFNVFGIALFYPVPALRAVPIRLAQGLADIAARNRLLVAGYAIGVFVVVPLAGLLIFR